MSLHYGELADAVVADLRLAPSDERVRSILVNALRLAHERGLDDGVELAKRVPGVAGAVNEGSAMAAEAFMATLAAIKARLEAMTEAEAKAEGESMFWAWEACQRRKTESPPKYYFPTPIHHAVAPPPVVPDKDDKP